jgi:hypothetical protein
MAIRQSSAVTQSLILSLALLAYASEAAADGSAQLGVKQALQKTTTVYADIVSPSTERITWSGTGSVTVSGPNGSMIGTFPSGSTIVPSGVGAHTITLLSDQSNSVAWDISVANAVDPGGRISSYAWKFNTGSFASTYATNASVYAVVPSGAAGSTSVIEMKMEGLSGYVYELSANRVGVTGGNGQSQTMAGHSTTAEFLIYLKPPTLSSYSSVTPVVSGFSFSGGATTSVLGAPMSCNQLVAGQTGGAFVFSTDVVGTYNLQCDLDGDGNFSRVGATDLLLVGATSAGSNLAAWDGKNNAGNPVAVGTYSCRVEIHAGEFHYVGQDIETSYAGLRLFEVSSNRSRTGLNMHWNDSLIQSTEVAMPNGSLGRVDSTELGVASGVYSDPAIVNVNARSWGNFTSLSKGNNNMLDTYVWLTQSQSGLALVSAVNGAIDTDGDGLSDFQEACTYGTDPANPDTDGNGVPDGAQYSPTGSSGGGAGGLESNGRLSMALARRAIARSPILYSPTQTSLRLESCTTEERCDETNLDALRLLELAPKVGPQGSTSKAASPVDLPAYTNAVAAGAFDYVNAAGARIGTVLILETRGELYEHSKAICDRAHGAWITGVTASPVSGAPIVGASAIHHGQKTRDGSLSFIVYGPNADGASANGNEGYQVSSRWLLSDYRAPKKDQQVLEIQVWARDPGDERELAQGVITLLQARGQVSFDVDAKAPSSYIAHAETLGGTIDLDVRAVEEVELLATVRKEDNTLHTIKLDRAAGTELRHLRQELPPFLDASIDVLSNGNVIDKVWLSDGAWVPFDASPFPGADAAKAFSFKDCAAPDEMFANAMTALGIERAPRVRLSGCGRTIGEPGRKLGVARHLSKALDLHERTGLAFHLRSNVETRICIESSTLVSFACADVPAQDAWVKLPWSAFDASGSAQPSSATTLIHFTPKSSPTESEPMIEVAGLAAGNWKAADDRSLNCSVGIPTPVYGASSHGFSLLILLACAALMARLRSQ